jgi:hypothetical protein
LDLRDAHQVLVRAFDAETGDLLPAASPTPEVFENLRLYDSDGIQIPITEMKYSVFVST